MVKLTAPLEEKSEMAATGKLKEIKKQLIAAGIQPQDAEQWAKMDIPRGVLLKFKVPTANEVKTFKALPKETGSLQRIRLPFLYDWSAEDIINAMTPVINKLAQDYTTNRTPKEDCIQQGVLGVLEAIRTDAGKASFWSHAFKHVQTKIRRHSAGSHLLRYPEKRPSKRRVREAVTAWLTNSFERFERDSLAKTLPNPLRTSTAGPVKYQSFNGMRRALDQSQKRGDLDSAVEIKKQITTVTETAKRAVTKLQQKVRLNSANLTTADDLIYIRIQKTGLKNQKQLFVKDSFSLTRLTQNQKFDLCDYLNHIFNIQNPGKVEKPSLTDGEVQTYESSFHLFNQMNADNISTVADLVAFAARPPDFHSTPVPWSVPMDDGHSRDDSVSNSQARKKDAVGESDTSPFLEPGLIVEKSEFRTIVNLIRTQIPLTHEQEVILLEHWGLDDLTQKTGTFIAQNLGKLTLTHSVHKLILSHDRMEAYRVRKACESAIENNEDLKARILHEIQYLPTNLVGEIQQLVKAAELKKVSRQRVTQYMEVISRKFITFLFDKHYLQAGDPKQSLEKCRQYAGLTPEEDLIFLYTYGLCGEQKYSFEEVARDLHCVIETPEMEQADLKQKKAALKQIQLTIMTKLVKIYY